MAKGKSIIESIKHFFTQAQNELGLLREKIGVIREEIECLEKRPIDLASAQTKLRSAIEEIGRKFMEDRFRQMSFLNEASPLDALTFDMKSPSAFELMAFLMPEQVEQRMLPVLAEFLERYPGVSPDERAAKLTELRASLRVLEVEEETLITEGQQVGLRIPRRGDASPEIVLGMEK